MMRNAGHRRAGLLRRVRADTPCRSTRRAFLIALGAGVLAAPLASFAQQQPVKVPRIGLLWISSGSESSYLKPFREGLRVQGYVEGKNIHIEDRFLVDRYDRLPEAAGKLVSQKVDVIVSYGATATHAARKATSTIPIIMLGGGDPVKLGLVASLSKPGRNVTGITFFGYELSAKRLELLKDTVPGIRRVGVLLNPESGGGVLGFRNIEAAARVLNLELQPVEIRVPSEIDTVISGVARRDVKALVVVGSTMFVANRKQVVTAIAKIRLPAIYASNDYTDVGGLLSYGPSLPDQFRRAATYVDKILKGAKPGDLPVEQPTKFELVVNLKTAKALGIKIPDVILLRADKLIE